MVIKPDKFWKQSWIKQSIHIYTHTHFYELEIFLCIMNMEVIFMNNLQFDSEENRQHQLDRFSFHLSLGSISVLDFCISILQILNPKFPFMRMRTFLQLFWIHEFTEVNDLKSCGASCYCSWIIIVGIFSTTKKLQTRKVKVVSTTATYVNECSNPN